MVGSEDQRRQAPLAGVEPAGWKVWTPDATEGREGKGRGRRGKEGSRREEREKRRGGEERGEKSGWREEGRERNGMLVERVDPVGRRASQAKQSKVPAKAKKAPEKQTQSKKIAAPRKARDGPALIGSWPEEVPHLACLIGLSQVAFPPRYLLDCLCYSLFVFCRSSGLGWVMFVVGYIGQTGGGLALFEERGLAWQGEVERAKGEARKRAARHPFFPFLYDDDSENSSIISLSLFLHL